MAYLLDTNIISALLKHNRNVGKKLKTADRAGEKIFISTITYYEITRGLLAVKGIRKMKLFDKFRTKYSMLGTDSEKVLNKAAEIYANLKGRGKIIQDADILIAAVAMSYDLTLVTDDSHFNRIHGLRIENWLRS